MRRALRIAVLAAGALSLGAADEQGVVIPHDGGVCIGIAWVKVRDGEEVHVQNGPDFTVTYFQNPKHQAEGWWAAYAGWWAQAKGMGEPLLRRSDVVIRRAVEDGKFGGYLAEKKNGWQNHFFGSIFHDSATDLAFFDRIDFGPAGQALCAKRR